VLDLPAIAGCTPKTGLNILLVTEFARTTQAFAVESVEDIVRLDWSQVLSAEHNAATGSLVTSIARLDGDINGSRLAQVLDVETISAKAEGLTIRDKVAMALSDLEMPEMDGFTLTRHIKNDERFKHLPVIIHSSLSGAANEDHVKGVGADAYIAKFHAEDLASTIRHVLNQ
jgi:CheY-like chemotaxis protein